jgi:uncharacterized protein involved in exopolysaccharide biosynthesis
MATEDFQPLEAQHVILIRKGATVMNPQNVLDTYEKLEEKIEELEEELDEAKAKLTQLLARYLTLAPLSADSAIERYKASSREYEKLKAELSIAKELQSIIEPLIKELKKRRPESKGPPGEAKIAESK